MTSYQLSTIQELSFVMFLIHMLSTSLINQNPIRHLPNNLHYICVFEGESSKGDKRQISTLLIWITAKY